MSDRDETARYLENWQDEVDSAAEYRAMAAAEADPRLAKVYANLAAMEEAHIAFWEDRLRKAGASVPRRRPSWRSRVLAAIARRFGPELVLPTIAAKEEVDQNAYVKQPETAGTRMPAHERWHAKVLKQLVTSQPRGLEGSFLGRLEGAWKPRGGVERRRQWAGALRDRRRDHDLHRETGVAVGRPSAPAGARRGGRDVRRRQADRRRDHRMTDRSRVTT